MVIPDHVVDLQVLVLDHSVGAHQRERGLVMKVLSLPLHRLLRLRQQGHRFPAAVAPLLAARDPSLRGFERAFGFAIPAGMEDPCAIR
jgi:hypothetical protein